MSEGPHQTKIESGGGGGEGGNGPDEIFAESGPVLDDAYDETANWEGDNVACGPNDSPVRKPFEERKLATRAQRVKMFEDDNLREWAVPDEGVGEGGGREGSGAADPTTCAVK